MIDVCTTVTLLLLTVTNRVPLVVVQVIPYGWAKSWMIWAIPLPSKSSKLGEYCLKCESCISKKDIDSLTKTYESDSELTASTNRPTARLHVKM